jgi:hypothetical protein
MNYPRFAWHIDTGGGYLTITHVKVISWDKKSAAVRWTPVVGMPPVNSHCPVSELASTRHKALKKLNQILTALESRPPQSPSGKGDAAPRGMTDSSAGKTHQHQQQSTPTP